MERGTQAPELLKPLEAVAGGGPGATAPLQPCTWGARHPAPGVPPPLLAVRTGTPCLRSTHWLCLPVLPPVGCCNQVINLHLGLVRPGTQWALRDMGPPGSALQTMRGWGSFLSGRTRPALNSNPTGRPQKASCGSGTRTASHSPYRGDSTLGLHRRAPGLGGAEAWAAGSSRPRARRPARPLKPDSQT